MIEPLSAQKLWNLLVFYIINYGFKAFLALIVIIIGYFVGLFIGKILSKGLKSLGLERFMKKHGRDEAFGGLKITDIIGTIVMWAIFSAFIASAATIIELPALAGILTTVSAAILLFLYAAIIFLVGLLIADILADFVRKAKDLPYKELLSKIIRTIIIVAAADVAVKTVGINVSFIETIIFIIIGAISIGLAIALGISFGDALKPEAKKIVEGLKNKKLINKKKDEEGKE